MIGAIIIALVGYCVAIFAAVLGLLGLLAGLSPKLGPSGKARCFVAALVFAGIALVFAAVTRGLLT